MNYKKLIHCDSADDVRKSVLEWSSDLTEEEHLIRGAILEIHATIEEYLKYILYKITEKSLLIPEDKQIFEESKQQLWKRILRMSFSQVYNLLKPGLDTFNDPNLDVISELNNLRNLTVHRNIEKVLYKNRNPFKESDCLAQIFFEAWAVRKILDKYSEFIIDEE